MKTTKKALLFTFCAVLLVVASVLGTMAYLTSSETVTNTFTVGKVNIKLDETEVKPDGSKKSGERVQKNEYHLIPGHTYIKDPTVTVLEDSEKSYVRMIVNVKNIEQLKEALPNRGATAKYYGSDGTFLLQMLCVDENGTCTWDANTWRMHGYTYADDKKTGTYEFRYHEIVPKTAQETGLCELFTHITVPGEIDNTHLKYLDDVDIVVNAHAIQADGFKTAEEAWAAFDNQVKNTQATTENN